MDVRDCYAISLFAGSSAHRPCCLHCRFLELHIGVTDGSALIYVWSALDEDVQFLILLSVMHASDSVSIFVLTPNQTQIWNTFAAGVEKVQIRLTGA